MLHLLDGCHHYFSTLGTNHSSYALLAAADQQPLTTAQKRTLPLVIPVVFDLYLSIPFFTAKSQRIPPLSSHCRYNYRTATRSSSWLLNAVLHRWKAKESHQYPLIAALCMCCHSETALLCHHRLHSYPRTLHKRSMDAMRVIRIRARLRKRACGRRQSIYGRDSHPEVW